MPPPNPALAGYLAVASHGLVLLFAALCVIVDAFPSLPNAWLFCHFVAEAAAIAGLATVVLLFELDYKTQAHELFPMLAYGNWRSAISLWLALYLLGRRDDFMDCSSISNDNYKCYSESHWYLKLLSLLLTASGTATLYFWKTQGRGAGPTQLREGLIAEGEPMA